MFLYQISGLLVGSEIELDWFSPVETDGSGSIDVHIVRGSVTDAIDNWEAYQIASNKDYQNLYFNIADDLFISVHDGRRIVVEHAANVSDKEISLFLVGFAWGVLCHQRHLLPLHCSAIVHEGKAYGFTGESGAGKSTLLTGLVKRGYEPCNDDLTIITPESPPRSQDMRIGAKLWEDAVAFFGVPPGEQLRLRETRRKFHIPHKRRSADKSRPLGALYVLHDSPDDAHPHIARLSGSEAWLELYRSVYLGIYIPWLRPASHVSAQVNELARSLPVFRFSRPRSFARFDQGLDVLEKHILAMDDDYIGVQAARMQGAG